MTKPALNQTSPSPMSATLLAELATIVGEQWVRSSAVDRLAYNNDCWPKGTILTRGRRLQQNQPAAIVQPKDEREIVQLVEWARKTSTPIVPYGAGSGVCGGAVGDETSIIVDMKRFKRIVETRAEDMTVRAQSGIIGMVLEKELERRGFTLGHFPSSLYCSSLGGYLAGRSAGQYSSRYGKIEDMVVSMRTITGTGDVIETAPDPLNAQPRALVPEAGPDLTQLMVGSEGTLGLITEATLNIEPQPTHRFYRGFQFGDVPIALEAIREMMQRGMRPTTVRLYDAFDSLMAGGRDTATGEKSPPWLLDRLRLHASDAMAHQSVGHIRRRIDLAAKGLLGRIIGQPLLLNSVIDVLPKECLLIVGFEGTSPLVEDEAQYAFDILDRYGLDLGAEPGLHWLKNRFKVSYKMSPMFDTGAFVDTMEVSTTWSNLNKLYENVRRALSPHVLVMAHFSHVYPEGSSIYFTFAGFGSDLDDTLETYETTWKVGLTTVAESGGSVAHHHGVGKSKAPWTHHDHPGGDRLFRTLKKAFDPDGILNPGTVYPNI